MARYVRVASANLTSVQDKLIILSDGLEGCRTFVVLPEATPVENLARQLVTVHQAYKAHAAASVLADADMQGEVKFGLLGSLARWAEKETDMTGCKAFGMSIRMGTLRDMYEWAVPQQRMRMAARYGRSSCCNLRSTQTRQRTETHRIGTNSHGSMMKERMDSMTSSTSWFIAYA